MPERISVAFVDDHRLLLEGVCALFARKERFRIVGKGRSADDARLLFATHEPDLIFLDLSMPGDVFGAIADIASSGKRSRVVVLTANGSHEIVMKSLQAGASAFISKDSISDELFGAADAVLRGELFISQAYAERVIATMSYRMAAANAGRAARLTKRDRQILALLPTAGGRIEFDRPTGDKAISRHLGGFRPNPNAGGRVEAANDAKRHREAALG